MPTGKRRLPGERGPTKEPRNALKSRRPDLFDGTDDELTVKERLWVLHYNANGGNASQAARDAGYGVNPETGALNQNTAWCSAKRIKKRKEVQEALRAVQANTTRELGDLGLAIRIRMLEVMLDDDRDRVAAAHLLAEMTPGALVPKESTVNVKGPTLEQMVLEAERLRRERDAVPVVQDVPAALAATVEAEGIDK